MMESSEKSQAQRCNFQAKPKAVGMNCQAAAKVEASNFITRFKAEAMSFQAKPKSIPLDALRQRTPTHNECR